MILNIWNDDCLNILKTLDDDSVDIIITSPPYNLKNKGGDYVVDSYQDSIDNDVYEAQQIEFLNECYRVLRPCGAMFYNHKNRYEKQKVITPYSWILKSKFNLHQEIIWNRLTTLDYNNSKFAPLDEKIFWLFKQTTFKLKKGGSIFTNIWNINRPKQQDNWGHKATFPYQLIYRIINSLDMDYSKSIILDPYLGTGTTLQVAKHFNFLYGLGIELDSKWIDVAVKKINTEFDFTESIPQVKHNYENKRK